MWDGTNLQGETDDGRQEVVTHGRSMGRGGEGNISCLGGKGWRGDLFALILYSCTVCDALEEKGKKRQC